MRLIDADALANKLIEQFSRKRDMQSEVILNIMLWELNQAQTEEGEHVVRCKDCKCWTEWANGTGSCNRFALDWIGTDADDFCSMGERKDDD